MCTYIHIFDVSVEGFALGAAYTAFSVTSLVFGTVFNICDILQFGTNNVLLHKRTTSHNGFDT